MIVFLLIGVLLLVFCLVHYLFPLVQVIGNSMFPTYRDSETLIGTRIYSKSKLEEGDVVVFKSPEGRIVIKRIDRFSGGDCYMYCLGDNPEQSYDSRNYGYVPVKSIVCKVLDQRPNLNK